MFWFELWHLWYRQPDPAAKAAAGTQGKVYGIDAAPEMIHIARQKAAQQQHEVSFQVGLI